MEEVGADTGTFASFLERVGVGAGQETAHALAAAGAPGSVRPFVLHTLDCAAQPLRTASR